MAARAPLQQGNALKTQNGTQEDNTGNLKQHCKRAMSSEDQMWIKFGFFILITALLKMLYYCWHAKAKHPILLHKFTSYFPKLIWHYLFTGEGREKMAVDGFSQAPLRLSWEQRISKFEKKNQLTCKCTDKYKFRNDYSRRCFYICGDVKLQAQPYCSP